MKKDFNTILGESLSKEMKMATAKTLSPSQMANNAISSIRVSLEDAKLGDRSAMGRIESELDAIERSLNEIDRFTL
jgi:hypothetical protein